MKKIHRLLDGTLLARVSRHEAPCDCGDHPRHWTGGNYHPWREAWSLSPDQLLLEVTGDTSDRFDGDVLTGLYCLPCGCLVLAQWEPGRPIRQYGLALRDACGADWHDATAFEGADGYPRPPLLTTHRHGEMTVL